MNRRLFLCTLGLALTLTTATALAHRRQVHSLRTPHLIIAKDSAYQIERVEPVLTRKIGLVSPDPQGRFVLVVQRLHPDPKWSPEVGGISLSFGEEKLWLYDALRHTTKLLYRVQDDESSKLHHGTNQITWFPGTRRALIVQLDIQELSEKRLAAKTRYGLFDAERGTLRWLSGLPEEIIASQVVPGLPGILLTGESDAFDTEPSKQNPKVRYYCLVKPDGTFMPVIKLPEEEGLDPKLQTAFGDGTNVRGISADGKRLYLLSSYTKVLGEKFIAGKKWIALDLAQGIATPLAEAPKDLLIDTERGPRPPEQALRLLPDSVALTGESGFTTDTNALWLAATQPSQDQSIAQALVAAEFEPGSGQLLPDLSAVLYKHDEALYAAPIKKLDSAALAALQKEWALIYANIIARALSHQPELPPDAASAKTTLLSRLKKREIIAGFVYTYKGEPVAHPAPKNGGIVLGYIPAPGGRAVVYSGGRVEWAPAP
jgi:hypothetical protein